MQGVFKLLNVLVLDKYGAARGLIELDKMYLCTFLFTLTATRDPKSSRLIAIAMEVLQPLLSYADDVCI